MISWASPGIHLFLASLIAILSVSWEDHPDVQDFREQDRIYKLAQKQSGADECEDKILKERFYQDMKKYDRKIARKKREDREKKCKAEREAAEREKNRKEVQEKKNEALRLSSNVGKSPSASRSTTQVAQPVKKHKKSKKQKKKEKKQKHKKCHKGKKHRCEKHYYKRKKK